MDEVLLSDDGYRKFSYAVFKSRDGSDLSNLGNWRQPLTFWSGSDVLQQSAGGPCGFFATLQAHMVLWQMECDEISVSRETVLLNTVLDIFERISSLYVFCVNLNPQGFMACFKIANTRDVAEAFLVETGYLVMDDACLYLTLGMIFASVGMFDLNVPEAPYIEDDTTTTVALSWLMLNGTTGRASIEAVDAAGFRGFAQRNIGIRVLSASDPQLIGKWLNPDASVFVTLIGRHFICVLVVEDAGFIAVYDNCRQDSPSYCQRETFHW
jgi:hypothetical protein